MFESYVCSFFATGAVYVSEGYVNIDGDMNLANNAAGGEGGETQGSPRYIQEEATGSLTTKR